MAKSIDHSRALLGNFWSEGFSVELVKTSDLQFDSYQRNPNEKFVKQAAENFDLLLFNFPTVGRRKNGTLWSVDGRARNGICERIGRLEYPARVVVSTGRAFEAQLFIDLNSSRDVKGYTKFRADIKAGNKFCLEIQAILNARDIQIGSRIGFASAISSLKKAHKAGVLNQILGVILECGWKLKKKSFGQKFMDGMIMAFESQPGMDLNLCRELWRACDPLEYVQIGERKKPSMIVEGISDQLIAVYNGTGGNSADIHIQTSLSVSQ